MKTALTNGSGGYPQWGLSWTYDRYSNRTAQTVTAGSGPSNAVNVSATTNRITDPGYSYDANGNMTADGLNALTYDAENRAVTSSGTTYSYDGNNLRVKKVSGSTTTVYAFSGTKVIAEYVNGAAPASPTREYIQSGGALLAKIEAGATKYYHPDHLSNRVITDSNGTAVEQRGHFPFGEDWYLGAGDKWKFTTYERDPESGNDYAVFRYYNNRLGRFSLPDLLAGSIADPQSLNRYAYVLNDPANLIDPLGLQAKRNVPPDPGVGWKEFLIQLAFTPTSWERGDKKVCADPYGDCGYNYYPVYGNLGLLSSLGLVGGPGGDPGGNSSGGPANNAKSPCISTKSLNWLQKAQLTAAQFYASLTGWTFGFGAGLDAGAGIGPKGSSWNFGLGGSASTLIVADASGNSGFLNSASGGFSATRMSSAGSWWGAGAAAGPSFLVSPFSISKIAGRSGSVSAGGGAVLGAGVSITTSGAATFTFGVGAGAEAGASPQFGTSQFIPFCHN